MPFKQSDSFWRPPKNYGRKFLQPKLQNIESQLTNYITQNTQIQGKIDNVIECIDQFCHKNWMMNLGDQKGAIVDHHLKQRKVSKILQIGGYCGYSALRFARLFPKAHVYTIQISQEFANYARAIQKHAGVADRITIHTSIVQKSEQFLKQNGPFDMIFIDHVKTLYLPDFLLLEKYGVIREGTMVVGDNIIYPGSPDYLKWFKESDAYNSILQKTYVEYSDEPDAVLFSQKIGQPKK